MSVDWRVSPQIPIQDLGRLDYERCGALHNEIVERAWVGAGNSLESLNRTTWWDRWHDDPSWPPRQTNVDPSVTEFYKIAIDNQNGQSFFWTVSGLYGPEMMFSAFNNYISEDPNRYILLYGTNIITGASHPDGIVLDQHDFTAIFQQDLDDYEHTMFEDIPWLPLDLILESFLYMIDDGKVVAFPPEGRPEPLEGREKREGVKPWVMEPYTRWDLFGALYEFQRLVKAIETRMPAGSVPDVPIKYGFFDPDEDDDFDMFPKHGFARGFLALARQPRFRFIAPGLWFVGADPGEQPFSDQDAGDKDFGGIRPVLLARGEADSSHGLFLTERERDQPYPWEDGCRLVLPYAIGENGYARHSDGSYFAKKFLPWTSPSVPLSSNAELFQRGYNQIIKGHDVQLKHVLERWAELVEAGIWEVDANGVAGGIEKWREADTPEHWGKYVLPMYA